MSLRQLYWAQRAKRKDEWERASNLMSFIAASGMGGKWIDPKTLNPLYEDQAESEASRKIRTEMAFGTLEAWLRLMANRQMGI